MQLAQTVGQLGQSSFTIRRGIAVPNDDATLGSFQGLQRALNAASLKFSAGSGTEPPIPLNVDGEIGPGTLARTKDLAAKINSGPLLATAVNVGQLAQRARDAAFALTKFSGVPPDFTAQRAVRPPPAVGPDGLPAPSPALAVDDDKKGIHPIWWIVGGVAILGAGYLGWRVMRGRPALGGADFGYEDAADSFIDV
jgi:hypothetical protein